VYEYLSSWLSHLISLLVTKVVHLCPKHKCSSVESSQAISLIPLLQGVSAFKLFFVMGDAEANKVQSSAILANLVA
jgi:hypothetical protein